MGAPIPERPTVALSGPELEALRLAVHRPEEVASRLETALFSHALARSAFHALTRAVTLHEAIEGADPQTADLLQRLAVEDSEAEPDDVMVRLVERAGQRELRDLQSEMREAPPAEQAEVAPQVAWLKLALEELRNEDAADRAAVIGAEERLVGWIVARHDEGDPVAEAT